MIPFARPTQLQRTSNHCFEFAANHTPEPIRTAAITASMLDNKEAEMVPIGVDENKCGSSTALQR
jgi:hypothetical protein